MSAHEHELPFDPTTAPGLSEKLLRELYFESLGGGGKDMVPAMALALAASFGSAARWREEFVAMGKALGGGSGWMLLSFQPREGALVNQWAADHTHALAGAIPILAMDMYEHASRVDHRAQAGAYVDDFMANVDWDEAYQRYQHAVHASSESLAADPGNVGQAIVLDVRRAGMFEQARTMLPAARWQDPAAVARWGADLPKDREVLVYCVYGHEVGRSTAMQLRALGVNARFLPGGIDAWEKAGKPVQTKRSGV